MNEENSAIIRKRFVDGKWEVSTIKGNPKIEFESRKKKRKKKNKRKKKLYKSDDNFYTSKEWRTLRYRVLKKHRAVCIVCGRTYRQHGVVIHVDHVQPRSKFPELELDETNLQIMCEDCNVGKSNKDCIDWKNREL